MRWPRTSSAAARVSEGSPTRSLRTGVAVVLVCTASWYVHGQVPGDRRPTVDDNESAQNTGDDPADGDPRRQELAATNPERDEDAGNWGLILDLRLETALNDSGFDLNQDETHKLGLDQDGLGARYRVRAEIELKRHLSASFDAFLGLDLATTHGRFLPRDGPSWNLDQVARGRTLKVGVEHRSGVRVYFEGQDHWRFAGLSHLVIDGPFEIYNMFMVGKSLTVPLGRSGRWSLDGTCELGVNWPKNEYGVNLRRPGDEATDEFGDNFGRYAIRCEELGVDRAIDSGWIESLGVYANLFFAFGRTVPQQEHTWSPRYIGHRRNLGVRARFGGGWSAYVEKQWPWYFTDHEAEPGVGPYGEYLMIGIGKAFDFRF